jgi:thioredoxin reductase
MQEYYTPISDFSMEYDVVIVGAGPAGLSAGINAAYLGMKVVVIDDTVAGGTLRDVYPWKKVDGYLGFTNLTGSNLASRLIEHTRVEGVQILERTVVDKIERKKDHFEISTTRGKLNSKSVILAIGCFGTPRKLGCAGEECSGVNYQLDQPSNYKGKKVLVVGGGDSALEQAVLLDKNQAKVTLIHRRDEFRATEKNVKSLNDSSVQVFYSTELKEAVGKKDLERVILINNKTKKESTLVMDAVFIFCGFVPNMEFLSKVGVKVNDTGHVIVDQDLGTSIPGIFAAGDITGKLKRIAWAIGEGALAAFSAFKWVKKPYWR